MCFTAASLLKEEEEEVLGVESGRIPTLVLKGVWGGGDQRQCPLQWFMTAIYQPLHQNPATQEQIFPHYPLI